MPFGFNTIRQQNLIEIKKNHQEILEIKKLLQNLTQKLDSYLCPEFAIPPNYTHSYQNLYSVQPHSNINIHKALTVAWIIMKDYAEI